MITKAEESRIRGCVLGAVLGDAMGAPFEFCSPEKLLSMTGNVWIDRLHVFERGHKGRVSTSDN